ncbi:MAG: leucine-rich repeat domain-containing protein [Bacteroidaceae bacterium]|nr:leucine-rich repeat domain-containing protein [Bacteroidaceae bacterium]
MKRLSFAFFLLLTSVVSSWAQTFYVDNIRYKVTSADEFTVAVIGLRSDYDITSIVIPESVTIGSKTYSVTAIDSYAFQDCKTLTSVTIGNNVRTIGYQTFAFCYNLTSVDIGNSVTMIDELAFRDCRSLTSVIIPNSMTRIIGAAFADCCSLTSVTIPSSVTMLDGNAFSGCSGLERIVVETGNPVYDSRNNSNAIIETASNTLISGCKNTVIPNNVTRIACCAFDGCISLTSISIPNSVTEIED